MPALTDSAPAPASCWSPPSPKPGWVLIPYANTAYARDTANASKTVFISGKPVMKKDRSCFKTSYGNEPAAGPKGFFTGVKKGKAYFTSWSMNVKVEGMNVDRHTDGMTHNHGSQPGNTPLWKYIDTALFSIADCKKEIRKMNKACGKNKYTQNLNWKKKNCKLLRFKPNKVGLNGLENPEKLLENLNKSLTNADNITRIIQEARDSAIDIAKTKAIELGAKFIATKIVPVAGWVYSAFTLADDVREAKYYLDMIDGAIKESGRITDSILNVKQDIQSTIDAIKNGDFEGAAGKLADWQRNAATLNKCLRARKCMLVPMEDTDSGSGGMHSSKGCCPGQTGHHLIPDAFVKGAGCSNYKYKKAPVVCAEGTTQNHGSHGDLHTSTTEMIVPKADWGSKRASKASYEDVRNAVIRAHAKTFPFSTCSRGCLKEQLDNYYKNCGEMTVKQIGGNPGSDNSEGGTSGRG